MRYVGTSPLSSDTGRALHGHISLLLRYKTRVAWARLPFYSSEPNNYQI
jgi:hypothetical protein